MIRPFMIACVLFLVFGGAGSVRAEDAPDLACQHLNQTELISQTLSDAPTDQLRPLGAEYFLDETGQIGPDRISIQTFAPATCSGIFTAPVPGQAVWLRFALFNPHQDQRRWVVAFIETIFDEVVLFEDQNGNVAERARAGRTASFDVTAKTGIKTGFPLVLQPDDARVFYLRIQGTFEPVITAMVMSDRLFSGWITLSLNITALFLFYVAMIAVFSVIVFRQVEIRFYQYYTLYMVCLFMFSFIYNGFLNKLFGVTLPVTTVTPVSQFFAGLGVFANVQYCRILLNVDDDTRAWRGLFVALSSIVAGATLLAAFDPWRLSVPLHLIYFLCPMVLLVVAIRKIRAGLPQAWPISGSLISLSLGLSIAVYVFIAPLNLTQASHAYELVLMRPLTWAYYLAIVGETLFMMVAISTMLRSLQRERRSSVVELAALGQQMKKIERQSRTAEQTTTARLEALETALAQDPENKQHLSAKQQFLDRVTNSVLDSVADESFGVERLASELAVSQKTLGRRLKEANGQSPASFIRSVRLNFARNLILLDQCNSVAEVARASGFSSVSNFAKLYRNEFGEAPSKSINTLRRTH